MSNPNNQNNALPRPPPQYAPLPPFQAAQGHQQALHLAQQSSGAATANAVAAAAAAANAAANAHAIHAASVHAAAAAHVAANPHAVNPHALQHHPAFGALDQHDMAGMGELDGGDGKDQRRQERKLTALLRDVTQSGIRPQSFDKQSGGQKRLNLADLRRCLDYLSGGQKSQMLAELMLNSSQGYKMYIGMMEHAAKLAEAKAAQRGDKTDKYDALEAVHVWQGLRQVLSTISRLHALATDYEKRRWLSIVAHLPPKLLKKVGFGFTHNSLVAAQRFCEDVGPGQPVPARKPSRQVNSDEAAAVELTLSQYARNSASDGKERTLMLKVGELFRVYKAGRESEGFKPVARSTFYQIVREHPKYASSLSSTPSRKRKRRTGNESGDLDDSAHKQARSDSSSTNGPSSSSDVIGSAAGSTIHDPAGMGLALPVPPSGPPPPTRGPGQ
jgi:hypothetical protein